MYTSSNHYIGFLETKLCFLVLSVSSYLDGSPHSRTPPFFSPQLYKPLTSSDPNQVASLHNISISRSRDIACRSFSCWHGVYSICKCLIGPLRPTQNYLNEHVYADQSLSVTQKRVLPASGWIMSNSFILAFPCC